MRFYLTVKTVVVLVAAFETLMFMVSVLNSGLDTKKLAAMVIFYVMCALVTWAIKLVSYIERGESV